MPRFESVPSEIVAEQFLHGATAPCGVHNEEDGRSYVVTAHEQKVYLERGDWIVPEPGIPDRYYPVKPNIFEKRWRYKDLAPRSLLNNEPGLRGDRTYTYVSGEKFRALPNRIKAFYMSWRNLTVLFANTFYGWKNPSIVLSRFVEKPEQKDGFPSVLFPEGAILLAIANDDLRMGFFAYIYSPDFPEVPEGDRIPEHPEPLSQMQWMYFLRDREQDKEVMDLVKAKAPELDMEIRKLFFKFQTGVDFPEHADPQIHLNSGCFSFPAPDEDEAKIIHEQDRTNG